jgi:hypothetical protein
MKTIGERVAVGVIGLAACVTVARCQDVFVSYGGGNVHSQAFDEFADPAPQYTSIGVDELRDMYEQISALRTYGQDQHTKLIAALDSAILAEKQVIALQAEVDELKKRVRDEH